MRLEPMQNQQVREEPQKLMLHKTEIMIYGKNVSIALANCHDRIYLMISMNNLDIRTYIIRISRKVSKSERNSNMLP